MRKFFLLYCCLNFFSLTGFTQQIEACLKLCYADKDSKYYSSVMHTTDNVEELSNFVNIPKKPYIKAVHSVTVSTRTGVESEIYIYTGIDKDEGVKYVIIDSNGNHDFGDDRQYTFPLEYYNEEHIFQDAYEYNIYDLLDITIDNKKLTIPIKINPYNTYDGKSAYQTVDEYMLDILPSTCYFYRDTIKVNVTSVVITCGGNEMIPSGVDKRELFAFHEVDSRIMPRAIYGIGDTLKIAYRKLRINKVENNTLYLDDLGYAVDSCNVGDYLPELFVKNLENDSKLLLNEIIRDKYVFIDFWGSWCGPCIKSLSELVKMGEEVKNRNDVIIVGIALENDQSSIDKLKKIIHEYGVWWSNFWQERSAIKSLESPTGKLRITSVPVYMVVGKDGKILFTSINPSCANNSAVDFFLDIIKIEDEVIDN